jgi:hypothetical protein
MAAAAAVAAAAAAASAAAAVPSQQEKDPLFAAKTTRTNKRTRFVRAKELRRASQHAREYV